MVNNYTEMLCKYNVIIACPNMEPPYMGGEVERKKR